MTTAPSQPEGATASFYGLGGTRSGCKEPVAIAALPRPPVRIRDGGPSGRTTVFLRRSPLRPTVTYTSSDGIPGGTMASENERVKEGRLYERRHRRNGCLADALRLQLEACREDEGL